MLLIARTCIPRRLELQARVRGYIQHVISRWPTTAMPFARLYFNIISTSNILLFMDLLNMFRTRRLEAQKA